MFCSIYFENLSASIRFLNTNKNIYYNRVTGQKYCIFLKKVFDISWQPLHKAVKTQPVSNVKSTMLVNELTLFYCILCR